ncbi:hypothetical protein [Leeuwenhoekiella marinoflava]|uniref:DUF7793 family protein n=1 Tax=Leeuwenhoekiella marinoflava TaxID=988 RepID=UPI003003A495
MAIDDKYAKMWLADGILYFVYNPIRCIDLRIAEEVVFQRLKLQNGIEYPVLCDLRAVQGATKDGRDYLAISGALLTKAQAFLVKDNYSLSVLNMYLRTTVVKPPTQIFDDENRALAFLSEFRRVI